VNLTKLIQLFSANGCNKVYVKTLAANDNSKNQIYFGGSFDVLNIFPIGEILSEDSGDWKRMRFKTKLNFLWMDEQGLNYPAPDAQLILYPKYPEVRFSGFLKGCRNAPSDLMANRIPDRLLFLGVDNSRHVLGYVVAPESTLANEFNAIPNPEIEGLFRVLTFQHNHLIEDSRLKLLTELKRIYQKGWIKSKRLGLNGKIIPCESSNCGGYTLEAELGISANGFSEPDYLGWEIKQFGVKNFDKITSATITLMTPEPTGGVYVKEGVEGFIRKFGYMDKRGRPDRMNFGGIHKSNLMHTSTGLKMMLVGFDKESSKITNTDGKIILLSKKDEEAASWSFASLMKHWNLKHAKAAYIPSKTIKGAEKQYSYGNKIVLGTGTDFVFFLKQLEAGSIYYDPGIKLENMSTNPHTKRRSQFRIKSVHIPQLYKINEIVNLDSK